MIYQTSHDRCGEAVARNIIKHYYKSNEIAYLKLINSCKSFEDISISLKDFGIECRGYEYDKPEVLRKIKGQIILLTEKEEKRHFVIYKGCLGGLKVIFDPAIGWISIKNSDFDLISTKKILICYLKERKALNRLQIFTKIENLFFCFFPFLEAFLIFFCFYFFIKNINYVLGVVSLFLLGIALFLERSFSISVFKNCMNRYGINYASRINDEKGLKEISSSISQFIKRRKTTFSSLASLILCLCLVIFSSMDFFMMAIISVMTDWIYFFAFRRLKLSYRADIEKEESYLGRREEGVKSHLKKAIEKTSDYGKIVQAEEFISGLTIFIFLCAFSFSKDQVSISGLIAASLFFIFGLNEINKPLQELFSRSNPYDYFIHLDSSIYQEKSLYRYSESRESKPYRNT